MIINKFINNTFKLKLELNSNDFCNFYVNDINFKKNYAKRPEIRYLQINRNNK